MKRLITEISTLQTSLPEGVFITHGSSRLDVMKVLIIGPNDTPYEYGLFEFDLYCPINYPNEPPKMCFKTTGGWRIRFNPNLYSDGKVCLSLLGTWSGEPWRPTQSTLLQVLVSIQSMILCEQPWYNEPGREFVPNQTSSIQYNNQIRGWVIQHALRPWINSIPEDMHDPKNARGVDPLWAKVVQLHLRLLGCQMMTAFETAAGLGADENLKLQAAELRKVLDQQGYVTSGR
ncbi:ubiquitin-conjugating enzyme/RWD-like protein [Xylariales sp. PMI_506]|nr:ubiquitin-conjugating enzyme/RWD-like protein [Xylariales sp. PMI_506]